MCLLYGTFIDLPVCAQHKSHSISLSKLKPLYGCQHTSIHYVEQRKDILLYASSLRLRKKIVLKKKNPWKKIFLPVCALMHFSVSWAYSFIQDLHLVLKYCMGSQNIFAAAFVLDSFLSLVYIIPCSFLLTLSFP